ncbi:unnamed protein product, partial [Amoebophrya sp. A25]
FLTLRSDLEAALDANYRLNDALLEELKSQVLAAIEADAQAVELAVETPSRASEGTEVTT